MGEFFGDEGPAQVEVEEALDHVKNQGLRPTHVFVSKKNIREIMIEFGVVALSCKELVALQKQRNLTLESIDKSARKNTSG